MSFPCFLIRRLTGLLALALAATLPACGGGGGGGTTIPAAQSVTWTSFADQDGYLTSVNFQNVANLLFTGDENQSFPNDGFSRGFVFFQHQTLPAGAQIQSAVLRVHVNRVTGSPLSELGPVIVAHVDYGPTLDFGEFNAGTLTSNLGTIVSDPTVGFHTLDVTAAYSADVSAGRGRSQFRLQHATLDGNSDGNDDVVVYEDGENTGQSDGMPELVITYTLP